MHPGCNPMYPGCNPMYLRHGQLADISLGFDDADLARYTDPAIFLSEVKMFGG